MRAVVFKGRQAGPSFEEVPRPEPREREVLLEAHTCGVCRTDLHVVDGDLAHPTLPLIPGYEIIGTVIAKGSDARRFALGDRVGVPWLGWTCGECEYCLSGKA